MMNPAYDVIHALAGKTLATAESCTGGGIGKALTGIAGASAVDKGGVISYCDEIKHRMLGVDEKLLETYGAVSAPVAKAMAQGAREALHTDIAVSTTGLLGPGGDDFGNSVGTVFVGYADENTVLSKEFHFSGNREAVRQQAIQEALELVLTQIKLFVAATELEYTS